MSIRRFRTAALAVFASMMVLNLPAFAFGEPTRCGQVRDLDSIPEQFEFLAISKIDCIRELIKGATPEDLQDFRRRVSTQYEPAGQADLKDNGMFDAYRFDSGNSHFWILSFWLRGDVISVSIRAQYVSIDNAARIESNEFRPEFMGSNSNAVRFLRARYGPDHEAMIAAAEAAGMTRKIVKTSSKPEHHIYEAEPPDLITAIATFGKKIRFFLLYEDGEFIGIRDRP